MENTQEQYREFLKVFKRIKMNPIFFIDFYYNAAHPENKIELTDEEKQNLYDEHRGIPFFGNISSFKKIDKYNAEIERLKKEGYKDWEIF